MYKFIYKPAKITYIMSGDPSKLYWAFIFFTLVDKHITSRVKLFFRRDTSTKVIWATAVGLKFKVSFLGSSIPIRSASENAQNIANYVNVYEYARRNSLSYVSVLHFFVAKIC